MLVNTIIFSLLAVIESFRISYFTLLIIVIYAPCMIYIVNRFMEESLENMRKGNVALIVLAFSAVTFIVYMAIQYETFDTR
jgi:hypothetical protein